MDTVISSPKGQEVVLVILVEQKTRYKIILMADDKNAGPMKITIGLIGGPSRKVQYHPGQRAIQATQDRMNHYPRKKR